MQAMNRRSTFEKLFREDRTGALIASSEDDRTRNAENDPKGMYQRIVDRFAKDLKEKVEK